MPEFEFLDELFIYMLGKKQKQHKIIIKNANNCGFIKVVEHLLNAVCHASVYVVASCNICCSQFPPITDRKK